MCLNSAPTAPTALMNSHGKTPIPPKKGTSALSDVPFFIYSPKIRFFCFVTKESGSGLINIEELVDVAKKFEKKFDVKQKNANFAQNLIINTFGR